MEIKICRRCGEERDIRQFHKSGKPRKKPDSDNPLGLKNTCWTCEDKRRREARRARAEAYRAAKGA